MLPHPIDWAIRIGVTCVWNYQSCKTLSEACYCLYLIVYRTAATFDSVYEIKVNEVVSKAITELSGNDLIRLQYISQGRKPNHFEFIQHALHPHPTEHPESLPH